MVTIKCSYTVIPSESTPKGPFRLSESDQIALRILVPTIYIYKPNQNHNIVDCVERLRDSLSKILVHYYPLAGRLRWIGGGRLEVDCNEMGVSLMVAESSKTLDQYGNFVPDHTTAELVPEVDYRTPFEEKPLLLVQLTTFSCGGFSLGLALSHVLADGISAVTFINSWAKLARGETLKEEDMPFLDRTIMKIPDPLAEPCFDHKAYEFKPLPLIVGSSDNLAERKKETSVVLLPLTRDQVEKLKNKANEEIKVSSSDRATRPYSRYQTITAHIWRCGAEARKHDEHQPTEVRFVGDIRNRLKPSLPRNYFGNAMVQARTPTCSSGEIISNPLCYAAQKMKEGIDKLTEEYIRSQLDFLASQENLDGLLTGPDFSASQEDLDGLMSPIPFFGNPNFYVMNWLSIPVHEANFGWGKAHYMGLGSLVNQDGVAFIIPGPTGDGSITVALCLQKTHAEAFREFFYKEV